MAIILILKQNNMKARIKATGEIVSVKVYNKGFDYNGRQFINYEDTKTRKTYADNQLDFDNTDNSPDDYWTRLEHQYAGMAMQGILSRQYVDFDKIIEKSVEFAHALVEKMKEERK